MKYVTGVLSWRIIDNDDDDDSTIVAVIIPDTVIHSSLKFMFKKINSAGFMFIENGPDGLPSIGVYGRSESLNVDSDPVNDVKLLRKTMDLK